MSRSSLLTHAVFSFLLMAACDDAPSLQQKSFAAQTEASNKSAAASNEAAQKAKDAQLEADKKVAAAKESLMKLREDSRHTTQTNLIELDRKVVELETKVQKAPVKARADLNAKIKQIHLQRDAFASNCKSLETETATTFDAAKARLDKEWLELKALVDNG